MKNIHRKPFFIFLLLINTGFSSNFSHTQNLTNWSNPVVLSTPTVRSNAPKLSLNSTGQGMAVWLIIQNDDRLVASSYYDSGLWELPITISASNIAAANLNVAVGRAREALCTWSQFLSTRSEIIAANFNGVWQSPIVISSLTNYHRYPSLDMNENGLGICVWSRFDETTSQYSLMWSEFSNGIWTQEQVITQDCDRWSKPLVKIDHRNQARLVWMRQRNSTRIILGSQFDGARWSTPQQLSDSEDIATIGNLAMNTTGVGAVTWISQKPSGETLISISRFSETEWLPFEDLSRAQVRSVSPHVAVNESGTISAIWHATSTENISIENRVLINDVWGPINTVIVQDVDFLGIDVAIDEQNTTYATWTRKESNTQSLFAASNLNNSGWATAQRLNSENSPSFFPELKIDSNGTAFSIWSQVPPASVDEVVVCESS